jgi:16S rRNA (cytidine1402-2'-O)-methyltransferase
VATSLEPVVLFEAPNRVRETLADLAAVAPERAACVGRELTKIHEELLRGTLSELASRAITERGEFTIVIAGNEEPEHADPTDVDSLVEARLEAGDPSRTIADEVSEISGMPRREVYARVLELRRLRDEG